ncbi:MAG: hypothetical protein J5I93_18265 [Pirellulaceae bacterium]|nr:hypothetical protein [Pirellulaceae bacterium]
MPLALHSVDYGVLLLYLLVMVAIGWYFSGQQHSSRDFFLAGRSMGWFPVGLSIMATLLSALTYSGIPGEAYREGLKLLVLPAMVWLTVPLVSGTILPLYRRLEVYSVYEYLELRFDGATRIVSSLVFVVWRLLWLGGVLYAPCKVLIVAGGLRVPEFVLLITLGMVGTLYTFLGGMKAVLWTDVVQALIMFGGLVLIIAGVWWTLDGGPQTVWEVAGQFERRRLIDPAWDWSSRWSVWGLAPHFFLSMLSFYVADQITVQRYLTTRDLPTARRSFMLNCLSVSIMIPALTYAGLCLLAYYQQHPESLRPVWVVNLDNRTRQPLEDPRTGRPLLDWAADGPRLDSGQVDRELVSELLAEGRLRHPNSKEPLGVEELDDVYDEATRSLRTDRLGMKDRRGEWILSPRASDELMPRFITDRLPLGLAGLILAALFAASMSSMDSGLNSIATLLITDFYRRLGIGRAWLARRLSKPESELNEADELRLARPLVLLIGIGATLFSLVVGQLGNIFTIMVSVVNTFGGPLLAVFLLGIFTRRATARAALVALLAGTLLTLWLTAANEYPSLAMLWPLPFRLSGVWPLVIGVPLTFLLGYGLSFVLGEARSKEQLRGLVRGVGKLGVREPPEASVAIVDPEEPRGGPRWK